MKKYISFVLIMVLLFSGMVFAEGELDGLETISLDVYDISKDVYRSEIVPIVNLMFGKSDILTTDVPAFILDGRTLVPIRFIAETLEAQVEWNQEKRQAIINKDGKEIILTIDSAIAQVNGKPVQLPSGVPSKLVSYQGNARTVVPFRFVSEQLGMEIEWIPDTYTAAIDYPHRSITDVTYTTYNGIPAIAIKADGKINYNSMYIPALKLGLNDKLLIDIPNTDLGGKNILTKTVNKNGILGIRASLYETTPRDVVRVAVELEMQSRSDTYYDDVTNTLYLTFNNKIKEIDYERGAQAVVIKTEETPIYNVTDLGDKVALDIFDAVITDMGMESLNVNDDVVKQIRYSQYDRDYPGYDKIARVVFELQPGASFSENMYIDAINNDIIAYTTTEPMDQLNYEYLTMSSSLFSLDLSGKSHSLVLNDEVNKEIRIEVDKSKINLLDDVKLDMYDNIVKYIQIDGETKRDYYILTIKYDSKTTAKIITGNTNSDKVSVQFSGEGSSSANPLYGDILIVIDPGHGGKDSGAYVGGVAEKTLNLDTSLKLKDLLEESGFKVAMTRTGDTYPGLYERAALANALQADLFLSVHHNSLPSKPSSQGVLTVYDGSSAAKTTFAKIIQRELAKGLPVPDMGLQNRPKIVVTRETSMPSALAELGFLTNDYERSLLVQDYYRQECAQALFNGIKAYVDTYMIK